MTAETRCPDCGSGMTRNGSREVGYRRLADGIAAVTAYRAQRWSCRRCPSVVYDAPAELVPGFRMTRAAFEAVARDCLVMPVALVAKRHGMDRRTAGRILDGWNEEAFGRLDVPSRCRFSTDGTGRTVAWDADDGRPVAAFAGLADRRLAAFAARLANRLVVADMRHAAALARAMPPSSVLCVERASIVAWFDTAVVRLASAARRWMDGAERRALRLALPALQRHAATRSSRDDASLAAASRTFPRLREFACRVDAFRRIWATRSAGTAAARLEAWSDLRTAFSREVFGTVAAAARRLSAFAFGPGYGADTVQESAPPLPPGFPGETPERHASRVTTAIQAAAEAARSPAKAGPRPVPRPSFDATDALSTRRGYAPG